MTATVVVTGSAGFIGSHLCAALERDGASVIGLDIQPPRGSTDCEQCVDLRERDAIVDAVAGETGGTLYHLAAKAEVVMPFEALADLAQTNIAACVNALDACAPERAVFASSSAVYGSAGERPVPPTRDAMKIHGSYGVSKSLAELAIAQWAKERSTSAVSLRFGNVIGARCRGLIPFLVDHALQHPDGDVPARLRGQGRIVRDYIPVQHVVLAMQRAADVALPDGCAEVLNIGGGRGLTNRIVAERVAATLRESGYRLTLDFDNPVAEGESLGVVLDTSETRRLLDLAEPEVEAVMASIDEATRYIMDR